MWDKHRRWIGEATRIMVFLAVADIPLILLISRFSGNHIKRVVANILVLEGALLLMGYALMASRRLKVRYHMERASISEGPFQDAQTREYSIQNRPEFLICAIVIILIGFLLNFVINFIG